MTTVKAVRGAARALLTLALLAGIGVAGYLVRHHESQLYGDASVVLANCPQTDTVNCEVVNTSAWSELFHVPIAAYAIPAYATVLLLLWAGLKNGRFLAYAFGIGLLATAYSVFLLWVSTTRIGFVCLWCARLYAINLSIPVLAALAAWRSPARLLKAALGDLRRPSRSLGVAATAFFVLLAATVGVQQTYRRVLEREAAAARARIEEQGGPLVPASPESPAVEPGSAPAGPDARGGGESSALALPPRTLAAIAPLALVAAPAVAPARRPVALPPAGVYRLAGPLRRLEMGKGGLTSVPFDLQARLGKGKPVGLIFWSPGFRISERVVVDLAREVAKVAPQIELYAVSGRRDDQKDEEIAEEYAMLDVPKDLPLLIDDHFVVSEALATTDVPDLALFSAKGALVVSKIKGLDQWLVGTHGNVKSLDVLRRVAAGEEVPLIRQMHGVDYSREIVGHAALPFTLPKLGGKGMYTFSGKPASGRPTLVMFWSPTCPHCRVEIPQLVAWVKAHPGAVDVVGVVWMHHTKPGEPSFRTMTEGYVRDQGIPWTIVEDADGAVNGLYENMSTPTTFFVAPSGRVTGVWYYAHPNNFDQAIAGELKKLRAAPVSAPPLPERPAPKMTLSMVGPDGKRVALASLLDRPAIVHFWATWCKPCVEELPALLKAKPAIEKETGARLVLVSVEDAASGARIAQFAKTLKIPFTSYRAPSGGAFDVVDPSYRVPRTYLVGKSGELLAILFGSQDWGDPEIRERVRSRIVNAP